jgi:hypothetical protein
MQVIIHIYKLTNIYFSINKLSDFMLATKLFNLLINSGTGLQYPNYNIRPKSSLSLPSLHVSACPMPKERKEKTILLNVSFFTCLNKIHFFNYWKMWYILLALEVKSMADG